MLRILQAISRATLGPIGGRSSMVEHQIVDLAVAGSNPVDHPNDFLKLIFITTDGFIKSNYLRVLPKLKILSPTSTYHKIKGIRDKNPKYNPTTGKNNSGAKALPNIPE